MFKIAESYYKAGLSVITTDEEKRPMPRTWKKYQEKLIEPGPKFMDTHGIAIVCGAVSGGLEIIDIDTKYDLTGTLYERFKQSIFEACPSVLKKLVVERSPSGGYHFLYRCSKITGNEKLARRFATPEEMKEGEKVKVLIETRGEGGYFVCHPSPGYDMVYGDITKINEITPEERDCIFECAKSFNEKVEEFKPTIPKTPEMKKGMSSFDDYDERGDVIGFMEQNGWTIVKEESDKYIVKRPGAKSAHSGYYYKDKKWLIIFSSSSEFEPEKTYRPYAIYAMIQHGGDFVAAAKDLYEQGYGLTVEEKAIGVYNDKNTFDLSTILESGEADKYVEMVRDGTLPQGLATHIDELDKHWLFKRKTFVVINGHDNTGKSTVFWYMFVLAGVFHKWKALIYSNENNVGHTKRKIMEFYIGKPIKIMSSSELEKAQNFFKEHFRLMKNETYSFRDLLKSADLVHKSWQFDVFLIDPYNSLYVDDKKLSKKGEHEYHYDATRAFREFIQSTGASVYLNTHAVTEALRRKDSEGYPEAPGKADTEGGGKFSNRADDFLTIHRKTQHPTDWMWTEIHVRKIKEQETGGRPTPLYDPVRIKMTADGCGFEDELGKNPLKGIFSVTQKSMEHEFTKPFTPVAKEEDLFSLPANGEFLTEDPF